MTPIIVKIWGSRGSCPAPFYDRMEFGGNTACISVEYGERMIVLDAGSGIVPLGLQTDWAEKKKRVDILISHTHFDHVMGLYQFQPFLDAEMDIHLYGPVQCCLPLRQQIEQLIRAPYWPLDIRDYPAKVEYHPVMRDESLMLSSDIRVDVRESKHPGKCLSYRLTLEGRRILYGTDCEMDDNEWEELVLFGKDCDLLVCDAQYKPEELLLKKGWGHSSWKEGNRLLKACNAGRVLHTHFDWAAADSELRERESMAVRDQPSAIFAREGMVLRL